MSNFAVKVMTSRDGSPFVVIDRKGARKGIYVDWGVAILENLDEFKKAVKQAQDEESKLKPQAAAPAAATQAATPQATQAAVPTIERLMAMVAQLQGTQAAPTVPAAATPPAAATAPLRRRGLR